MGKLVTNGMSLNKFSSHVQGAQQLCIKTVLYILARWSFSDFHSICLIILLTAYFCNVSSFPWVFSSCGHLQCIHCVTFFSGATVNADVPRRSGDGRSTANGWSVCATSAWRAIWQLSSTRGVWVTHLSSWWTLCNVIFLAAF